MVDVNKFLKYALIGAAIIIALTLAANLFLASDNEALKGDMAALEAFLDTNKTEGFNAAWAAFPPRFQTAAIHIFLLVLGLFALELLMPVLVGFAVGKYKGGSPLEGGLGGILAYVVYSLVNQVILFAIKALGLNSFGTLSTSLDLSLCRFAELAAAFLLGAFGAFVAKLLGGVKINININVDTKFKASNFLDYALKGAAILVAIFLLYEAFILIFVGPDIGLLREAYESLDSAALKALPPAIAAKRSTVGLVSIVLVIIQLLIAAFIGFAVVNYKKGRILEAGIGGALAYIIYIIIEIIISLAIKALGVDISLMSSSNMNLLLGVICLSSLLAAAFMAGAAGGLVARHFFSKKPAAKKKK